MIKLMAISLATSLLITASFHNSAQAQSSSLQPPTNRMVVKPSVPDESTLARLVWSTMIALDNANRTENYSVIYALGSPQFQQRNSPQKLSQIFASLRQNRVDIGRTILASPSYYIPAAILPDGTLRLRGGFDFRPKSVRFDLIYVNNGAGWQISALSVVEMDATAPK